MLPTAVILWPEALPVCLAALQTNLAASFLLSPSSQELIAWATSTDTEGGPVKGATAYVYSIQYKVQT
jgi:hypothetical protein